MSFTYRFDWDPTKAAANRSKHGVSFEQACEVFRDPLTLSRYDEDHSENEERWVSVGRTSGGKLLVVSHTFEEPAESEARIRIISAREATGKEQKQYDED